MDLELRIEPVTALTWPLYKLALASLSVPGPLSRPKLGLMLTRPLRGAQMAQDGREAIAGACLYFADDIALVLYPFARAWKKEETAKLYEPGMKSLGDAIAQLAYFHGKLSCAFPATANGVGALAQMGYTKPIPFVLRG